MKKLLFLLLLFSATVSYAQSGAAITGIWLNEEKDAKILVYASGNKYYGKLIWGKNIYEADGKTSKKDSKNDDESLRNRDLLNLIILKDFTYDDGEWSGGTVYDPKSGNTYNCIMKLKGKDLQITGYIGFSIFGRTTVWTKVQ